MKRMAYYSLWIFCFLGSCGLAQELMPFTVVVEQWLPFTIVDKSSGKIVVKGPMGKLLAILSEKLSLNFTYIQSPDGRWGAPVGNGSWSGMIGVLLREEADVAVGPFTVTLAREEVVDFSIPLVMDSKSLMMQRPQLLNDIFAFLNPFNLYIYIALIICVVAFTIFYKVVVSEEENLFPIPKLNPSLSTSLLWTVKTFLQEGSSSAPATDAGKMIVATWLLSSFILMASYAGTLTAMLTVPRVEILIDSVEDLLKQDTYSWKLEGGSSTYLYFQNSDNPVHKKIFNGMNGTFYDCFKSCAAIGRGEFVGFCDISTIKKCMHFDFSTTSKCNIYAGRQPVLAGVSLAMAFRANSTLKDRADLWIHRIHQTGIWEKWIGDEMVNASQCMSPPSKDGKSSGLSPLSMESYSGPFICLCFGYVVSLFSLGIELISGKFMKNE